VFARVVKTSIDLSQYDNARQTLEAQILPTIRKDPGVVAGYWLEPVDGKGLTIVFFKSKEAAESPAMNVQPGDSPAPGVTVESVEIREVIGSL